VSGAAAHAAVPPPNLLAEFKQKAESHFALQYAHCGNDYIVHSGEAYSELYNEYRDLRSNILFHPRESNLDRMNGHGGIFEYVIDSKYHRSSGSSVHWADWTAGFDRTIYVASIENGKLVFDETWANTDPDKGVPIHPAPSCEIDQ
jgi:hypothetical protein